MRTVITFIVFLALLVQLFFLCYVYTPRWYYSSSQVQGEVAYNVANYNKLMLNSERSVYVVECKRCSDRLIDLADINRDFGPPDSYMSINDTIGYGVLLGLLWKVTQSFRFIDIQLFQLCMFLLSMLLYMHLVYLLFGSLQLVLICSLVHLCNFPLIAMNVQPVRDIWAYYGALLLLYLVVYTYKRNISLVLLVVGGIGFAVCQWLRPTVFMALLTTSFCAIVISYFYRNYIRCTIIMLTILWLTNVAVFWIPFCMYNKQVFNRCIVGPAGQDLLEGLGEFENPWGYTIGDDHFGAYMKQTYNLTYGTPECDEQAKLEFMQRIKERPLFYILTIIKRLPRMILPGMSTYYEPFICSGTDWFMRRIYIRLYILLGYLGLALLYYKRRYTELFLLIAIILGGWGKLPSHVEYRYLIPFYWVFSISMGYALYYLLFRKIILLQLETRI